MRSVRKQAPIHLRRDWLLLAHSEIRGAIDTQMLTTAMEQSGAGAIDDVLARVAAGRKAKPVEVASVITFLLSDASICVTGAAQTIDGGWFC